MSRPSLAVDPSSSIISCSSFDSDISSSTGIYIDATGVERRPGIIGDALFFNGAGKLELPFFANAYSKYPQFSVSFWFKRTGGSGNSETLITNGNCLSFASIAIISVQGTIYASVETPQSGLVLRKGIQVRPASLRLYSVETITTSADRAKPAG